MRYRLRTLVLLTAVGPPLLAVVWWLNLAQVVFAFAIYGVLIAGVYK